MIVKTYGKNFTQMFSNKIFKLDDKPLKSIRHQDLTLMSVVFTQCSRELAGAGACRLLKSEKWMSRRVALAHQQV